jgi:hypothetical protein
MPANVRVLPKFGVLKNFLPELLLGFIILLKLRPKSLIEFFLLELKLNSNLKDGAKFLQPQILAILML